MATVMHPDAARPDEAPPAPRAAVLGRAVLGCAGAAAIVAAVLLARNAHPPLAAGSPPAAVSRPDAPGERLASEGAAPRGAGSERGPASRDASARGPAVASTGALVSATAPAAIAGRLLEVGSETPLAGARIDLLWRAVESREGFDLVTTTATDDFGAFSLEGVRPGAAKLRARHEAAADAEQILEVAAGERREVEIHAHPAGLVVVTVRTPEGEPARDARVDWLLGMGGSEWAIEATATPGRYEGRVPATTGTLYVFASGFAEQGEERSVAPGERAEIAVVLSRGATVAVSVHDAGGRPVAGARIEWEGRTRETDAEGRATLDRVGPSGAWATISAAGWKTLRTVFRTAADGATLTAEQVTLEPAAYNVAGYVRDRAGHPVAGAIVVGWAAGLEEAARATSGSDGRFGLVAAGIRCVAAFTDAGSIAYDLDRSTWIHEDAEGEIVVWVPSPPVVALRLVSAGPPLPQRVRCEDHQVGGADGMLGTADVGRSGEASRTVHGTGAYDFVIGAPGFATLRLRVEVSETADAPPLEVALVPGARATGRVVGPDGAPIEGAEVILDGLESYGHGENGAAATGADGRFEISDLPADARLSVTARGFETRVVPATLAPERTTALGDVRLEAAK
jgi:hypothetical protein